jgi:hypothetical protein
MDTTSVLIFRIKALEDRLQYLLDTVEPKSKTEPHWTQQELARTITERLQRVREITKTQAKATRDSWNDVIAQQKACALLFREALAFLRVQAPGVVDGNHGTDIARALVVNLAAACHLELPFVVTDVTDEFSDYVQIIRVRFPPAGIWDLPVVAHEFGHFAAYRFTRRDTGGERSQPMTEFVRQYLTKVKDRTADAEKRWRRWLSEFYADAFGVYTLGPSFTASALLTRFDVAGADRSSDEHPSYAARASLILRMLERMDERFGDIHRQLADLWQDMLASARVTASKDGEFEATAQLEAVLRTSAPDARYNSWSVADEDLRFAVEKPARAPRKPFSVRDLMNAAWRARLAGGDPVAISDRVRELWRLRLTDG